MSFEFVKEYLSDPYEARAKAETREMWEAVNVSNLSPEDQAKRERIRPVVEAYLDGHVTRAEYEHRLAG